MKRFFYCKLGFFLSLVLVLGIFYTLVRILFYFSNYDFFNELSSTEVIQSFFIGLQFDLSAIVQSNSLFILAYLFSATLWKKKYYKAFLKFIFLSFNICFLFLAISGTQFFPYVQKHISKATLFLLTDFFSQLESLSLDYWWIYALLILSLYLFSKIYDFLFQRFFSQEDISYFLFPDLISAIFILSFTIVASRGGFQNKSLSIAHAQELGSFQSSLLILNTPFTFIHSFSQKPLAKVNFFPNNSNWQDNLKKSYCPIHIPKHSNKIKNVMIILIESLGAEFIKRWHSNKSYVPFLDNLESKGAAFFPRAYANATRSIQSLPPILASLPNWMDLPFIKTPYVNNHYLSLGKILQKKNYKTLFLHGGKKGTMYFDTVTPIFGLEEYYGAESFYKAKGPEGNDGVWGIFDELFFQYSLDVIQKYKNQKFFAFLFSLSSHHPFIIPEKYKDKFPKNKTPFHRSMAYTDYSLQKFFERIEKEEWAKKTLFVITADHTSDLDWKNNLISRRRIPLFFYQPQRDLSFLASHRITQHMDIFPSILDIVFPNNLKVQKEKITLGLSLLDKCNKPKVVLYDNGAYWLLTNKEALVWENINSEKYQYYKLSYQNGIPILDATKFSQKREKYLKNQLKARIQYYNNGLIKNTLLKK